ncbi:unnamed protein product [Rotaria sordida]|uniref:Uncharacterized protein n=1 Tax=Rotaria sordida TaxID=392033 RepID=A0A818K7M1_9BILA|nr:unnamed protein product [Rotaria sordida]
MSIIHILGAENRFISSTDVVDLSSYANKSDLNSISSSSTSSFVENNLGLTPWNNLSKLNETIELECLQILVEINQILPSIGLIFNAIVHNHIYTYKTTLKDTKSLAEYDTEIIDL